MMTTRKPPAPKPPPSRGRGLLGLAEDAHALLAAWGRRRPAILADVRTAVVALTDAVDAAIVAAEEESAIEYDDDTPREADVAARLGVSPSTLARWRARRRREAAAE